MLIKTCFLSKIIPEIYILSNSIVLIDPFEGGHHSYYATILASGLSSIGWDVYLIGSSNLINNVKNKCKIKGDAVISIPSKDINEYDKYNYLYRTMNIALSFKSDIIHILTLDRMIIALFLVLLRYPKITNLYATLHWGEIIISDKKLANINIKKIILRYLLKRLVANKMSLIMHSKTLVMKMDKVLGKVGYAPYPHNIESFDFGCNNKVNRNLICKNIPDNAIVLLCFGATRRDKRSDVAVKVLSKLSKNYYLLIVGSEDDITKAELIYIAKKYNVSDRLILYLSFVSEKDLISYFHASDALFLPYKKSFCGQSGPLVLAASLNIPVVASPALVIKETIEMYDIGVVAKDDDEENLYNAICELFADGKKKYHNDEFIKMYSADYFVAQVIKFYNI